ncbi:MAG: hypothetical protein J6J11_01180 [Treponema sp.]|nr:hypothetical protein [Treponema sp.]
MHKLNQSQTSKKDYERHQDEIQNPDEDYFDVRKSDYYHYKSSSYQHHKYNKENPY